VRRISLLFFPRSSPVELLHRADCTSSKDGPEATHLLRLRRPPPPVDRCLLPSASSHGRRWLPHLVGPRAGTTQMAHRARCRASGRPNPKKWPRASAGLRVQPIVPARHEHEGHQATSGWAASCLGRVRVGWAGQMTIYSYNRARDN
jgi:hypothetical protein